MKGKLHKTKNGWTVQYEDYLRVFPFPQTVSKEIPLHPYLEPNYELGRDMDGEEVEFEIEDFWETGLEEPIRVANTDIQIDETGYPLIDGTLKICNEIIEKRELKEKYDLAESLWEGCDGCDESDKNFWMKGFVSGLNYYDAQIPDEYIKKAASEYSSSFMNKGVAETSFIRACYWCQEYLKK